MSSQLVLTTVSPAVDSFVDQIQRLVARGAERVHIAPWNSFSEAVAAAVSQAGLRCRTTVDGHPDQARPPAQRPVEDPAGSPDIPAGSPDIHVRTEIDGDLLAQSLMGLVDLRQGNVLIPRTDRFGLDLPLFLISIPKAGTHALIELARVLGFTDGGPHDGDAAPGSWHYVEYSNSHTVPRDFFVDTVRRSPFGNRTHPFITSPALFIYRHPYDILVSEANYYHMPGKTAFSGYLCHLTFEQRLERLADDPWLLGSLRDRIGRFAAWLDFGNVVPLSFEELIGAAGGGDRELQRRALWSLLLKLQVDGNVDQLAGRIFNPYSPTFHYGAIGRHRDSLTPRAWTLLNALDSDYLEAFGYSGARTGSPISARIEEFRRRPLRIPSSGVTSSPILMEQDFLGWNLIKLRGRYYACHLADGPQDLSMASRTLLAGLPSADSLGELRNRIIADVSRHHAETTVRALRDQMRARYVAPAHGAHPRLSEPPRRRRMMPDG